MMERPPGELVTEDWLTGPRQLAMQMIEKYGQADEISDTMLIWHNNGTWKRTILRNEELPHNFPQPHKDKLENVIDYHVPPEKASDLERFDGSILFDRTKGEMSARCDSEAMNFLALNLANDIVTGKLGVDEARGEYAKQVMDHMQGRPAPYTEGLKFQVQRGGTADPDQPVMKAA